MRERLRPILDALAAFLAPGLVLMLLGIQVALGLRGFDQHGGGLLAVMQVPGILLGWGGVLLLLPLLLWLVLDWWGYEAPGGDMGGLALKGLGSAVVGIAAGALFGLAGGRPLGGLIGGALAGVLGNALGTVVSVFVLGLLAAPAAVLALSLQRRTVPKKDPEPASGSSRADTSAMAAATDAGAKPRFGVFAHVFGRFFRPKAQVRQRWYPKQRFDAWGNELPMDFEGQRDVGGIRFADEGTPAAEPVGAAEPEADLADEPETIADLLAGEERLPTIPELLAGNFERGGRRIDDPSGGPRELADDETEDDPIHVDSEGRPRRGHAPGRRVRTEDEDAAAPAASGLLFAPADPQPEHPAEKLPPGVRYAEPSAPAAGTGDAARAAETDAQGVAEPVEEQLVLSQIVREAVRGPAVTPRDAAVTRRTIRETLRARVETIRAEAESPHGGKSRYLQKLEALGMFEPAEPLPASVDDDPAADAVAESVRPRNKRATKKRAVRKKAPTTKKSAPKKQSAAKKKARKKTAAKRSAGNSSPTKAVAAKASATKASATKKRAARRKAPKPSAAGASKATATRTATAKTTAKRVTIGKKAKSSKKAKSRKRATGKRAPRKPRAQAQARAHDAMLEGLRIERLDPLFARAVEAALERGAASPVLLTRRLGLPFARASALLERMAAAGILGEPKANGASPLHITRDEWRALGSRDERVRLSDGA